ncbi:MULTISPECIES: O-antigen polymerase [Streptococcus]|uniref:O-antigen polymerase n=1 Tax=Streptococcus caledonicus TaxID=2614158 RepID=A0ABW0UBE9_9STRE|nr:O-antigen polymerase [Streptococcus sp. S784/96/1]
MLLIITAFMLLLFYSFLVLKKDFKSPIFIFTSVWFLILTLYTLKLFGIYSVEFKTEVVLSLGILSFILGYYLYLPSYFNNNLTTTKSYIIHYGNIRLLAIIILLLGLSFYKQQFMSLLEGRTLDENKILLVLGKVDSGGAIMQYIVRPFEHIFIAISAFCIFHKPGEKFLIFSGLLFTILRFLSNGSKIIIVYFVMCLVFSYLFAISKNIVWNSENFDSFSYVNFNKFVKVNRKYLIFFVIAISIFLIIYMKKNVSFLESLYFYLTGSVVMLDKTVNTTYYLNSGYTYTATSLYTLWHIFYEFLSFFGLDGKNNSVFQNALSFIERTSYTTYVSDYKTYNAFVTMFAQFYADFGYFGVIGMSGSFGFFANRVYNRLFNYVTLDYFIIYCIILYYVYYGMVRFQMSSLPWGLSLLYSLFLIRFVFTMRIKIK